MDAATLSLLQDALNPGTPVVPRVYDPEKDVDFGLSIGDQLQRQALQRQSLALQQARVDALPLDKRYNSALQEAQITRLNAQAEADRARAALQNSRANPSALTLPEFKRTLIADTSADDPAVSTPDYTPPSDLGSFSPAPALDLQSGTDADAGNSDDALNLGSVSFPKVPDATATTSSAPASSGLRTVTTFGTNLDGSIDKQDNGVTAFGDNSRDPSARIISVPFAEARQRDLEVGGPGTLAHFKTLPVNLRTMALSNPANGKSTTGEVREFGPSEDAQSGATGDVTPAIMREVGGTGKDQLAMNFVDPDGGLQSPSISSIVNGPQVAIHGAEDPNNIQTVGGAFAVPRNQAEAQGLKDDYDAQSQQLLNLLSTTRDHAQRDTITKQLANWKFQYNQAMTAYSKQQAGAARATTASTKASAASAAPPDETGTYANLLGQGFKPESAEAKSGGVTYKLKQGNPQSAFLDDVEAQTGTRNLGQLKAGDVGNVDPRTNKPSADTHFFKVPSKSIEGYDTVAVPQWWYDRYIAGINKNFGGPSLIPATPAPSNDAAPASSIPGLQPVRLALGRRATVPALSVPSISANAPAFVPTPQVQAVAGTPSPAATDPTIRLAALRQQQTGDADDPRQKEIDAESKATSSAIAEDRKYNAGEQAKVIADKFDFDAFPLPQDQSDPAGGVRVDSPFDPLAPTGSRDPADQQRLQAKIAQAAKAAGIGGYDLGAVINELRRRRAQRALDDLSPDPEAEALASKMQANRDSLPDGFVSSVGVRDRVIPNSGR